MKYTILIMLLAAAVGCFPSTEQYEQYKQNETPQVATNESPEPPAERTLAAKKENPFSLVVGHESVESLGGIKCVVNVQLNREPTQAECEAITKILYNLNPKYKTYFVIFYTPFYLIAEERSFATVQIHSRDNLPKYSRHVLNKAERDDLESLPDPPGIKPNVYWFSESVHFKVRLMLGHDASGVLYLITQDESGNIVEKETVMEHDANLIVLWNDEGKQYHLDENMALEVQYDDGPDGSYRFLKAIKHD